MGNELLNKSMIIKLHSPPIANFNPDDAITMWSATSLRSRRSLTNPLGQWRSKEKDTEKSRSIVTIEDEIDSDEQPVVEPLQAELELNVQEDNIKSDTDTESIADTLPSNCVEFEQEVER